MVRNSNKLKFTDMKKLIFLLMFALMIGLSAFGQRRVETGSIVVPVGMTTDTTIFIVGFYTEGQWSISFEYGSLTNDDWTISLGNSKDWSFDKIDDSRVPYTLDATTNAYTDELGNSRATVTFTGQGWRSADMGIQINVGTANAETIPYKYMK